MSDGTPDRTSCGTRLHTRRLVLRTARPADAPLHRALWEERDPRVPPHRRIGADDRPTTADLAESIGADRPAFGLGLLTIETLATGSAIGYCGVLAGPSVPEGEPELAYELLRGSQGFGFATEAGASVVRWVRDAAHPRLWATVRRWNGPSLRVAARLGFVESGRIDRDPAYGDSVHLVKRFG